MAFLAKFAASKFVEDKLEDHFGPENPRYDILITEDGRRKKNKKPLPTGLSIHEERVLETVRRKAWRYEWWVDCHCCCGLHVQFGTAAIWGIIPVVGDLVSLINAVSLIRAARRTEGGLPGRVLVPMLAWALIDFVIKLVPVVGDILTAIIKPNTRNCARFEALLRRRGERNVRAAAGGAAPQVGHPPLLVSAQPGRQNGMSAGRASYGTVSPATGSGSGSGSGSGRPAARERGGRSSRHLLPFWRRNDDTDSEEDVEARR